MCLLKPSKQTYTWFCFCGDVFQICFDTTKRPFGGEDYFWLTFKKPFKMQAFFFYFF